MISADVLVAALAKRHADDVFVAECKDGATQTRSHRRLDAWVLLKTWSPVTMIGYEVKVSLSDWRRDQKLSDYYALCHVLYVVAPKGVVPHDELPAGVGLLEMAGTGDGARLITKRKPERRHIDIPVDLLVYVLMCRSVIITRDKSEWNYNGRSTWQRDQLKQWVEEKEERRELSYALGNKIRAKFDDQERRLTDLREQCARLENIRSRMVELGFNPDARASEWRMRERLQQLSGAIDSNLLRTLKDAERYLSASREAMEAIIAAANSPIVTQIEESR